LGGKVVEKKTGGEEKVSPFGRNIKGVSMSTLEKKGQTNHLEPEKPGGVW